jgi:hypothetical protein
MTISEDVGRKMFMAGLLCYVVSFFLVAVDKRPTPEPQPGWNVALLAFAAPITKADNPAQPVGWAGRVRFQYVAIKISGLINVVFILAVTLGLSAQHGPRVAFKGLRILVILMMPFCWIAFRGEQFYPREGYFLWTLGMMFVLFSERLGRPAVASVT